MSQNSKKKMTLGSSFTGMFKRLFKKEQLSALEEEGVFSREGRCFTVLDPARLTGH